MKKKEIFRGTATALITPFRDGEIDYPALYSIIDAQISAGIDALVIGGTTGEAATLDEDERYRLYSSAAEHINGRTKLIFGTGTNDTRCAIRHTRRAEEIGCDAVLVVTPYYNKGTDDGLISHYTAIADASDKPLILYNVPSRTGVNLSISQLRRLAEHPMISAIKEASDSLERMVDISLLGDSLALYSGNDSQIYPTLALGGLGVISVISNLLPKETGDICRLYFDKKPEKSRLASERLRHMTYGSASGGVAFPEMMAEACGLIPVKEAVSGTTLTDRDSSSYVSRLKTVDTSRPVDLFICQLSTNDASKNLPLDGVEAAIRTILSYVRETWGCPIVFYTGTYYESPAYAAMVELLLRLQAELGEAYDFSVLDLWNHPAMRGVSREDYARYMRDPVHPTALGYREWWTPVFIAYCEAL